LLTLRCAIKERLLIIKVLTMNLINRKILTKLSPKPQPIVAGLDKRLVQKLRW